MSLKAVAPLFSIVLKVPNQPNFMYKILFFEIELLS